MISYVGIKILIREKFVKIQMGLEEMDVMKNVKLKTDMNVHRLEKHVS